jgi:hypothetical protein
MSQIFHPNVVLFMGASTDPKEKLMVVTVSTSRCLPSVLLMRCAGAAADRLVQAAD